MKITQCIILSVLQVSVAFPLLGQVVKRAAPEGGYVKNVNIDEYERLVKYYRYYKLDSAIFFAGKGIELARGLNDSIAMAGMLVQIGMIDDNQGQFDSSKVKYQQALEIFKRYKVRKGIASTTIRIGVVELRNGKYDKAIKFFFEALKLSENISDNFGVMEANYSISWVYLDRKDYKSAYEYLKKAEQLNDRLPFSSTSLNIFNHLGVVYRETGNYKKAEQYLEKGIRLSNDIENQGLNITLINNLASVYSKQGLKNKAIKLQEGALARARTMDNYLRELQVLYGLARTYGKEEPSKSIFYLEKAVLLARAKGSYNQETRYIRALIPIYVQEGDYKQAYLMKDREHQLADSFYFTTITKNIQSLKAEYDLSKSNAKIRELALINNKRQLELEKANILHNVTFIGIGLLLVILILLYNQYRIKQRTNRNMRSANQSLQYLLDEKERLLKEVHHRVKNNLHTVMSLLETQSTYLKDDALAAVQNSQHRVYAMSLIHQKLYQLENSTNINLAVYIPELIDYLRDSFDVHQRIRFRTQIENIELDISKAIPIGLILNESITNALKYAFPGNAFGEIRIEIKRFMNDLIKLTIKDNGIGFPPDREKMQTNSLGLKLMKGLSEDINGTFLIEHMNGTKVTVEFHGDLFVKDKGKRVNNQRA